jgi:hydrogenase maturation protease
MKIAVLGIGNLLLGDEGVGVHSAAALRKGYTFRPEIEIIDGGTMGLDLLPYIQDHDKIIVIDAVDFGKEPGYISVLGGKPAYLSERGKISAHNLGLSDLIFGLTLVCEKLPQIYLVGVQPGSLEMRAEMTEALNNSMTSILKEALRLLDSWGIACTPSLLPEGPERCCSLLSR